MNFVDELIKQQAEIYLVGGAIRNMLYNHYNKENYKIKDRDLLICKINTAKLVSILSKYGNVKLVGISFGIIKFKEFNKNMELDIAIPRKEVSTGPGYRDFIIESDPTIDIIKDFERRDATINSIGLKIFTINELYDDNINFDNIIDPFNGISDIKNKLWRSVGDPLKRFNEDPIRILRAFRQSAELSFSIEENTLNCIKNNYKLLELINYNSSVRIMDELLRILRTDCYKILCIMDSINLLNILKIPNDNIPIFNNISPKINLNVKLALLLNADQNKGSFNWCIDNKISSSVYFDKNWVNFIDCVSKKYSILQKVKSNYDIRVLLQDTEKNYVNYGREYLRDLVDYYHIKNGDYKFVELYNQNKNFLISLNDLDINGNDLMIIYNLRGQEIKKIKEHILDEINKDKLKNIKEEIFLYLSSYLNG